LKPKPQVPSQTQPLPPFTHISTAAVASMIPSLTTTESTSIAPMITFISYPTKTPPYSSQESQTSSPSLSLSSSLSSSPNVSFSKSVDVSKQFEHPVNFQQLQQRFQHSLQLQQQQQQQQQQRQRHHFRQSSLPSPSKPVSHQRTSSFNSSSGNAPLFSLLPTPTGYQSYIPSSTASGLSPVAGITTNPNLKRRSGLFVCFLKTTHFLDFLLCCFASHLLTHRKKHFIY
jgi:hypothetical protein